jgi:uncharacterized membrane protein
VNPDGREVGLLPSIVEASTRSTAPAINAGHDTRRRQEDLWYAHGLAACTLLIAFAGPMPAGVRFVVGCAAVLVGPGYVFTEALFPGDGQVDGVARLGTTLLLSMLASIAWIVVLGILSWRIDIHTVAIGQAGLISFGAEAARRRRRTAPEPLSYRPPGKLWPVLGAMLVVAGLSAGITLSNLNRVAPALYLTDARGQLMNYPYDVPLGNAPAVVIHVSHLEHALRYRVVTTISGHPWKAWAVHVVRRNSWAERLPLPHTAVLGTVTCTVQLFKGGSRHPYREVWLNYRVIP